MAHKDYSGTPLHRKLGIKQGSKLALVGQPDDFLATLGSLPSGVEMSSHDRKPLDVVVFFTKSRADLERRFATLAKRLDPAGGLWVAYPKKSSPIETDLTFPIVQRVGLENGLVDNKSIAVDDDWSGVRFVYRVKDRPR